MRTELNNVTAIFCPEVTQSPKNYYGKHTLPYLVIGILVKALEYIMITVYTKTMKILDKIFIVIASCIIITIVFATAIAFVSGSANPGGSLRSQDPSPQRITSSSNNKTQVYSQIGTLRCSSADDPSIPIVVSPYFPYPSDDKAFYEELFKKNQRLRMLVRNCFEVYTREELLSIGEDALKEKLLESINAELVLGKITEIYFAEYIFLE